MGTLFQFGCNKTGGGRYISDKDTTFSKDIRDISGKINEDPSNAELFYRRANAFYFEKKFKDALTDIDYAIVLNDKNPIYLFKKGECLMESDSANGKLAIEFFDKSLALKPDFEDALFKAGIVHLSRQNYEKCFEYFDKVLKKNPLRTEVYIYKGKAYKEQNDTSKAIEMFKQTLIADPNNAEACLNLGILYSGDNMDLALQYLNKSLSSDPYNDLAFYAKGKLLQDKGIWKEAIKNYESALENNSDHRFAYYNLAFCLGEINENEKAIEKLDRLIELDNEYANAYWMRGFLKEKSGNSAGAIKDYEICSKLDPENKKVNEQLKVLKSKK